MGSQLRKLSRNVTREQSYPLRLRIPAPGDAPQVLAESITVPVATMLANGCPAVMVTEALVAVLVEVARGGGISLSDLIVRLHRADAAEGGA